MWWPTNLWPWSKSVEELGQELVEAAKEGKMREVELLLKSNADVNSRDKEEWTALHYASYSGDLELVETLLAAKADIHAKTWMGVTPLHVASIHGRKEVVEFLLKNTELDKMVVAVSAVPDSNDLMLSLPSIRIVVMVHCLNEGDRRSLVPFHQQYSIWSVIYFPPLELPNFASDLKMLNSELQALYLRISQDLQTRPVWRPDMTLLIVSEFRSMDGRRRLVEINELVLMLVYNAYVSAKAKHGWVAQYMTSLESNFGQIALQQASSRGPEAELLQIIDMNAPLALRAPFPTISIDHSTVMPYVIILITVLVLLSMWLWLWRRRKSPIYASPSCEQSSPLGKEPEDLHMLFPYHQDDPIPFHEPGFKQVPQAVASEFKELCCKTGGSSLRGLLANYKLQRNNHPNSKCLQNPMLQQWLSSLCTHIYPAEISLRDIVRGNWLGRFDGFVYSAKWQIDSKRKIRVAYKKLRSLSVTAAEVTRWMLIPPHENVARLYGAVFDFGDIDGFVAELRTTDTLLEGLELREFMELGERGILRVLLGVAKGLRHLHQNNIIHGDIFARNILLKEQLVPIITDFGSPRRHSPQFLALRSIPRGTAPEVFQRREFTFESDVYSLGVLVWEMANPAKPTPDRLTFNWGTESNEIAANCCNMDPKARPTIDQVIEMCTQAIARADLWSGLSGWVGTREKPTPHNWESISNNICQLLVTFNWRKLHGAIGYLLTRIEADLLCQSEQGLIYITEEPLFFELAVFCNMGLRVLSRTPPSRWSQEQQDEFNALCAISRDYALLLSRLGKSSYGPTYFAECRWVVVYLLAQSERWEKNFTDVKDFLNVKIAEAGALHAIASLISPSLWTTYHQFLPKNASPPKNPSNERISSIKRPVTIYSTTFLEITGDEDWITAKWILRIWQLEDDYVTVPQGVDLSSTLSKEDEWLDQLGWSFEKPPPIAQEIVQEQRNPYFSTLDEKKFQEIVARQKSNLLGTHIDQENEVKQWLLKLLPNKGELLLAQGFDTWNSIFHLMESDLEDLPSPPSPPSAPPKPPRPPPPRQPEAQLRGAPDEQPKEQNEESRQPEDEQPREQPRQPEDEQPSEQAKGEQGVHQKRECDCRITTSPDTAMVWTNDSLKARALRNRKKIINITDSEVPFAYRICLYATKAATPEVLELEQFLRQRLGGLAENPADCKYLALANILRSETVVMHMSSTILCNDSRDQVLTAYSKGSDNIVLVFLQPTPPQIPTEHRIYHWKEVKALQDSPRKIQSTGDFDSISRQLIEELEPQPDLRVGPWLRALNPRYEKYIEHFAQEGFDSLDEFQRLKESDEQLFSRIPRGHFRAILADVHKQLNERSYWREFKQKKSPSSSPSTTTTTTSTSTATSTATSTRPSTR